MSEAIEKMIAQQQQDNPLLSSLHEISLPADISWWPQTVGWQCLLLLLVGYLLYRLALIVRRYQHNAYRRAARLALLQLSTEQHDLALIPQILRRTALYAYQRQLVSPLIGQHWELWLDQQCKGVDFSGVHRGILDQLAYAKQANCSTEQIEAFKLQVLQWVKHHRGQYD